MTFDLLTPISNQFIFQSKWMSVPNVKKFPQDVLGISCSEKLDGQKASHSYHQHGGILMIENVSHKIIIKV